MSAAFDHSTTGRTGTVSASAVQASAGPSPRYAFIPVSAPLTFLLIIVTLAVTPVGCGSSTPIAYRAAVDSDTLSVPLTDPVASFEDARAMDLSPSMRLYVADAGADVVRLFEVSLPRDRSPNEDPGGPEAKPTVTPARPGLVGGTGTAPGLFLEPASVDASSALFLLVADAGNGRIQRFTADGVLVEAIPVPRASRTGEGVNPRFRVDEPAIDDTETGARPTLVESTSSNDILILDAGTGDILMTDVQRRNWIRPGSTGTRPIDPVDIEVLGSHIHVADAVGNRIFVYDRLGSLVGTANVGGDRPLNALVPTDVGMATLAGTYLTWPRQSPEEQRSVVLRFDTSERVRDVRPVGDHVLVLTNRSLFLVSRPMTDPCVDGVCS